MDLLQNAGVPVLKNPPWDSVISLQTAWPWKVPFSTKFLSSSMGPGIFFYKMTCHPKLKWALDLFTRWPHYKMTHSGLKATHFVWEIRRRILFPSLSFLVYLFAPCSNPLISKKMLSVTKTPEQGVWAAFIYKMFCLTPFCHWLQNAVRKVLGNA